jgi:hypothetical protein
LLRTEKMRRSERLKMLHWAHSTTQAYEKALDDALAQLRSLLGSSSKSWKPVASVATSSDLAAKGKARELANCVGVVDPSAVLVHRRAVKGKPDILRAVADVPVGEGVDPDNFRAVLQTSEISAACELNFPPFCFFL